MEKVRGLTHWCLSLWRILGGRRLAVILLVAVLLASLLASLFPQMPTDPASRETWLEAVALRYGQATALLRGVGLFDAYHSFWFVALLAALLLNTFICTIQRLPRLWRSLTRPPAVVQPEGFYRGFAHRAEWSVPSRQEGLVTAQNSLLRHRYRPHVERDQAAGSASLYAEKGRWSQVATLVGHLAAVLLAILVVARPALSWQDSGVTLLPGQVYSIDHGQDLTVRAGPLIVEQQRAKVSLAILSDSPTITRTVRINQPLTFRGVALHLQSYGPAVQVAAPEGTFGAAFSGSQAQEVTLPQAGLTLRIAYQPEGENLFVEALTADGTLLGSGSVTPGQEIEINGLFITFSLTDYTMWQVSHDPMFGLVVATAGLLLVAAVISLWIPQRRLWLRVDGEKAQMVGAGDWADEFDALAAEITLACYSRGETDG